MLELWHAAGGAQNIEVSVSGFKTKDITGHNQQLRPVRYKIIYILEEHNTCNFRVEVCQVEKEKFDGAKRTEVNNQNLE